MQLMRDIIFVLGTQGGKEMWNSMDAIHRIVELFTVPLQGASANIEVIVLEFVALV